MLSAAEKSRVVRFGLFEVDPQEGELRKSGLRIKLQDQPFQILTMLLERPGETLTREELRKRLWPADTFVDFDHSLNSSIKKLREALGDDSENPRFIETLHRRGYRFIAPVTGPQTSPVEHTEKISPATHSGNRKSAGWQKGAAALFFAGALLLVLWLRSPLPQPRVWRTQELTTDGLPKSSLVTDGNRVYFTEYPSGRVTIAQVSSSGGETITVNVSIPNPSVVDISKDKSELLVQALDGSCWSIPLPAGSPHRLGDVSGRCVLWSPEGKLLFASGERIASILEPSATDGLYLAEHDGSNPRKIATAPGSTGAFSFSPDGSRLRFTVTNPTNWTSAIWEARADGSDMHPLLPGWNEPPSRAFRTSLRLKESDDSVAYPADAHAPSVATVPRFISRRSA